jgi:drug/metabolite transporter (DMT)-like permease
MIAAYEIIVSGRRLTPVRAGSLGAALVGISLLVLGGGAGHLALNIGVVGLVVGLLSALTAAYNTLASLPLIRDLGPWATTSWGMVLGGIGVAVWAPPWRISATGNPLLVGTLVAFVVVFGTLAAFGLYFMSLRHLAPTDAAIAVTVEPVTAAVASLLLLHVALQPEQYAGGALIVAAVVLLRAGKA